MSLKIRILTGFIGRKLSSWRSLLLFIYLFCSSFNLKLENFHQRHNRYKTELGWFFLFIYLWIFSKLSERLFFDAGQLWFFHLPKSFTPASHFKVAAWNFQLLPSKWHPWIKDADKKKSAISHMRESYGRKFPSNEKNWRIYHCTMHEFRVTSYNFLFQHQVSPQLWDNEL